MQYILQSLVSDAQIAVGFVLGTIFVTTVTLVRMTLKARAYHIGMYRPSHTR